MATVHCPATSCRPMVGAAGDAAVVAVAVAVVAQRTPCPVEEGAQASEDEEDFEAALPPPPPHQSFGSVWDSQLGVPGSAPATASAGGPVVESFLPDEDEEDLDEPEIPEYLLAERRQRPGGGAPHGRMGRGRGAYQAALDRERFGRGAPAPSGFGANAGRLNRSASAGSWSSRPFAAAGPPSVRPTGPAAAADDRATGRHGQRRSVVGSPGRSRRDAAR